MLPEFLSDTDLSERYGVHRTTVWRWVRNDPAFPRPIALSAGCTRWKRSDIEYWEAERSS